MEQPAGLDIVKKISRGNLNISCSPGSLYIWSQRDNTHPIFLEANFSKLSPPVVPIMVFPVSPAHRMWQSAYSGGFFAPTNFLGQSSAERRTDVYVLTFTAPVDSGRTSRMGETLCILPPIFSFSQLCHQDVNSRPWTISNLQLRFVSSVVPSVLLTSLFGCPTLRGTWV